MSGNTTGIVCSLATCPIDDSFYAYRPSLPLNTLLLALFGLSLMLHLVQGVWYRTWTFAVALVLGTAAEIIGYVGRVLSYIDPFSMNPFLAQICCLTFAPAFIAAGIYLCLSRIVTIYGTDISRIRPIRYTQIFITCDIFSLVLQGAGGGIASVRSQNNEDPALGTNIMVAGLAFQVFTIALFMLLCAEYAYRVLTSGRKLDPAYAHLRGSKRFTGFLWMIAFTTICIQIRSIYRLIELSQGWKGELISNETYFFVLEGIMVILAVLSMTVFHPGYCLREAYNARHTAEKNSDVSSNVELTSVSRA